MKHFSTFYFQKVLMKGSKTQLISVFKLIKIYLITLNGKYIRTPTNCGRNTNKLTQHT